MLNPVESNWCNLDWSPWMPLDAELELYREHISREPGFYRVRTLKQEGLFYIGQTGRNLRERTSECFVNRHTGNGSGSGLVSQV